MATIVDGKRHVPFMRGMLIHYLIQRGFGHEDAIEIANATRQTLGTASVVRRKDIVHIVRGLIAARSLEGDPGDLVFWEPVPTSIAVEGPEGLHPLARETLAHQVQVTGLEPPLAYEIAAAIEQRLIDLRRQKVSQAELATFVAEHLHDRIGPACAARYRLWHRWRELELPLVVLIGGATGVGKTTLAVGLANLLGIPRVVATDDIRQVMRLMLSPELMPALHPSSYVAGKALPNAGRHADLLIDGFREQVRIVSVGVRAIVARCVAENASVIVDGVHLLPDLLGMDTGNRRVCFAPLTLAVTDRQELAARFAERAKHAPLRPQNRYLAHLKHIARIQEYVVETNKAQGVPLLDTAAAGDLTSRAVMLIGDHLARHPALAEATGKAAGSKAAGGKGAPGRPARAKATRRRRRPA